MAGAASKRRRHARREAIRRQQEAEQIREQNEWAAARAYRAADAWARSPSGTPYGAVLSELQASAEKDGE